MSNPIPVKTSQDLVKILDRVRLNKIKAGMNQTLLSRRRLTLALARLPNLEKTLMEAKIEDDRK
jgi:hypothetical protein